MPSRNAVLRAFGPKLAELKSRLRPTVLPPGHHLTEPGDPIDQLYFPVRGVVSSRVIFETDHEIELVTTGVNNAVGILAAVGFPKSLTRDVCVTEGQGWTIRVEDFQEALRVSPRIGDVVRTFAYAQMAFAVRVATCNAMHTAEQRFSRWLLLSTEITSRGDLRLSQEELARVLGIRRSHLNPLLRRLQNAGLISVGRGRLELLDRAGLKSRTCECHELLHHAMRAEADPPAGVVSLWAR